VDLVDGKKSHMLQLPTDCFQLRMVLGAHHRLLQIQLGEEHVLPLGILQLIGVMEDLAPIYLNNCIKWAQQCAKLMSAIDIYTWSWADQQHRHEYAASWDHAYHAATMKLASLSRRVWRSPFVTARKTWKVGRLGKWAYTLLY
jgi:hypothetical protein